MSDIIQVIRHVMVRGKVQGVGYRAFIEDEADRKSTRLNSSHIQKSRMPSSA